MKKIDIDIAGSGELLNREQMKKTINAGYTKCRNDECNLYIEQFGHTYQGLCGGPDGDTGVCYCYVYINGIMYSTNNGGRKCYA